jgi:hypothetical protein
MRIVYVLAEIRNGHLPKQKLGDIKEILNNVPACVLLHYGQLRESFFCYYYLCVSLQLNFLFIFNS